jgi:hypothetical protein
LESDVTAERDFQIMSENPFDAFKSRLQNLEASLSKLSRDLEADLEIARSLQQLLIPNRTREFPGLTTYARIFSAFQVHTEAFDLIATKDEKELWFVSSWTESFGLSSVLLQALVRLQSEAAIHSRPGASTAEIFNEVSTALTNAKKAGHYRLCVARLRLATLEMQGHSVGFRPFVVKDRKSSEGFAEAKWAEEYTFRGTSVIEAALSSAPKLASDADEFLVQVKPGARLFWLSSGWDLESDLPQALKFLKMSALPSTSSLLDDVNHLMLSAQQRLKERKLESDITALAIEVSPRKAKLHLV